MGQRHGLPRLDRGGHCGRAHGPSRPGGSNCRVRGEVAAAVEEARLTQEAIAGKEAEVKAPEEALAQERAKKEAEERAHAKATAKAQADAARKDTIEAARRKVAEERARKVYSVFSTVFLLLLLLVVAVGCPAACFG